MLHDYPDIRSRIKEEPLWFNQRGVPRYDAFTPELASNIYANEVALLKIACQACRQTFLVGMESSAWSHPLSEHIEALHYGDPPPHECPGAGSTMNCIDLRIIEFWRKDQSCDWIRVPELEVPLED
jgi:hypothetical protein